MLQSSSPHSFLGFYLQGKKRKRKQRNLSRSNYLSGDSVVQLPPACCCSNKKLFAPTCPACLLLCSPPFTFLTTIQTDPADATKQVSKQISANANTISTRTGTTIVRC